MGETLLRCQIKLLYLHISATQNYLIAFRSFLLTQAYNKGLPFTLDILRDSRLYKRVHISLGFSFLYNLTSKRVNIFP